MIIRRVYLTQSIMLCYTISVHLKYTDIGLSFPISMVNSHPSSGMAKAEARFIREEDIISILPTPAKMLSGLSHASDTMPCR